MQPYIMTPERLINLKSLSYLIVYTLRSTHGNGEAITKLILLAAGKRVATHLLRGEGGDDEEHHRNHYGSQ